MLFGSCKKSSGPPTPPQSQEPIVFGVSLEYRTDDKATIYWSENRQGDPFNSKKSFQVFLDAQVIESSTTNYRYEFTNLKGHKTYKVKIVSTMDGKDPLVAELDIPAYEALGFQIAFDPNLGSRALKCVDLVHGPKWTFANGSYLHYVMPGIDKIYLFAGSSLVALDTATGSPLSSVIPPGTPIGEPVWNDTKIIYPSGRNTIICINKSDGSRLWETGVMNLSEYTIGTMNETYYYYRAKDGPLTAYDINTGGVKWTFDLASPKGYLMPSVTNNVLVVATDRQVFALGASDGTLKWSHAIAQGASGRAVTIADSVCYVPAESSLSAIDLFTGKMIWQNTDVGLDLYAPTFKDFRVYSFSKGLSDGTKKMRYMELKKSSGLVNESRSISYPVVEPVVVDNILYYQPGDARGFEYYLVSGLAGPVQMHGFAFQDGPVLLKINRKPVFPASSGMKP